MYENILTSLVLNVKGEISSIKRKKNVMWQIVYFLNWVNSAKGLQNEQNIHMRYD